MLILASTSDKIQLTTGAAALVDVHASYMDFDGTNVTPGRKNTASTTATTTDIVVSPAASVYRNVKSLTIENKDTISCVCTVKHTDGTTTVTMYSATLLPGDMIEFVDGVGFVVRAAYGTTGIINYSTADQSPTAATRTYLTGSLITLPRTALVGSVYRWRVMYSKTGAGTATSTWDIAFGTNGTTGDTARCSFTGPTETAAIDAAEMIVTAIVRGPIGASAIVQSQFTNNDNLITTGLKSFAGQTTSAAFDITPAGTKVGLCLTSGTADVVTVRGVIAEAFNL